MVSILYSISVCTLFYMFLCLLFLFPLLADHDILNTSFSVKVLGLVILHLSVDFGL